MFSCLCSGTSRFFAISQKVGTTDMSDVPPNLKFLEYPLHNSDLQSLDYAMD